MSPVRREHVFSNRSYCFTVLSEEKMSRIKSTKEREISKGILYLH